MITKNTTHPQQQKETQMNKKAWLDTLYYDLGHQWTNFWTTSTWLKNGEPIFTKWKTFLEVQENEELWSNINQRSLLINEIVLEYDGGWPAYLKLIKSLRKAHMEFKAYSTEDHRAKHIHLFFEKEFAKKPEQTREKYRLALIHKYGCDKQLIIDKHCVALENCVHWKTKKVKELIANG